MAGSRCARHVILLGGMLLAASAHAQQVGPADPPPSNPPPLAVAASVGPDIAAPAQDVTTLGEVRALRPEDDQPLDLYRFRSPVRVQENRFSRDWSEPPTPEQVSVGGGYIMMGVVKGAIAAAKGINKLTGGPDQIQSAIARPPPALSAEQQRRALQFCAQQEGCGARP